METKDKDRLMNESMAYDRNIIKQLESDFKEVLALWREETGEDYEVHVVEQKQKIDKNRTKARSTKET